jgi:enoyl-CoA hydratase
MTDRYAKYTVFEIDRPTDRVLRLAFNRPETYNSLDADGHAQLTAIWRDIDADPDLSAVIITGKGKAFSAGGDFSLVDRNIASAEARAHGFKEARQLVFNMLDCNKPIISAINGVAVGAGLVAALLADISIAGRSARIIDGHTRLGVAAGDHAAICWPLLCGMAKAKYLLMTCEPVDGAEAERIGLVSLVVDDAELQERAVAVAKRLTAGAPSAIRWTKHSLNNWYRAMGPTFDASLALEMLGFASEEPREGVASLREKRAPDFSPESPL